VLQGDPTALQPVIDQAGLDLLGAEDARKLRPHSKEDDLEAAEAVVLPDSPLVGRTTAQLYLRRDFELNVLVISRGNSRDTTRLQHKRFEAGDIIVLQGHTSQLTDAMARLGCVPLVERNLAIGRPPRRYLPLLILVVTMAAVGAQVVPVEEGFFVAATLIPLQRIITVREAYASIDWPVIVMLGCLIPVGAALKDTGAAGFLADGLTAVAGHLPGMLAVGLVLVVSMLITPFLHHAAAVLVMAPVAPSVAKNLGYGPDAFLMAVAFGAACDFLTPIGHQNSTLVMRPAGYRFGDYWQLGLPLSITVAVLGTWLITLSWPLR
jgi:di/tricarboxylate transporter